ncbi:hypothetical protein AAVH_19218 [Aphelenchoides avenae]|nr:hypothetical protein AAVH_19218 [Aphelenchus avenae]
MIGIWMFSFSLSLLIIPIEFFFRYLLVCRKYLLSARQLLGLGALAVFLAMLVALPLVASVECVEDHKAAFGHLMTDSIWFDERGQQAAFFGTDKRNPFFLVFIALSMAYNTIIYGFSIFCGTSTFLFVRSAQNKMSNKTRYLQKQMNRLMFAELASATIVGDIPVAICIGMLIFNVTRVGVGK